MKNFYLPVQSWAITFIELPGSTMQLPHEIMYYSDTVKLELYGTITV